MGVIARRLQDTGELWRHVYKSLLLLEYMLKHGPQKVRPLASALRLSNRMHIDRESELYVSVQGIIIFRTKASAWFRQTHMHATKADSARSRLRQQLTLDYVLRF